MSEAEIVQFTCQNGQTEMYLTAPCENALAIASNEQVCVS